MPRINIHAIEYGIVPAGFNAGRFAVFVRFAGCPLWDGTPRGRTKGGACAAWCDAKFKGTKGPGGGTFDELAAFVDVVKRTWPGSRTLGWQAPLVVLTGGEPAPHVTSEMVGDLVGWGFNVAMETSGAIELGAGVSLGLTHLVVSPKAGQDLVVKRGGELRLPFPQEGIEPARFESLEFRHLFLEPIRAGDDWETTQINQRKALAYAQGNPRWRVALPLTMPGEAP